MAQKKNGGGSKPSAAPAAAPAKSSGGGLSAQVQASGSNLSKNEALKIAEATSKSVAEVMAKALDKGVTLGAGLVNNFNSGNLGPSGNNLSMVMGRLPVALGQSPAVAAALQQLQALQGLKMGSGQVYAGYSTTTTPGQSGNDPSSGSWHTPGSTTYNPIVLPKNYAPGGGQTAAPAAPAAPATGPVANWETSVENSNQELINSINAQIEANRAQADLYMGQINNLMSSMQQASQGGGLQSITPYATTTTVAPASGAQMTQAITARKKPTDTDLSISPLVGELAGTGLNIAI